MGKDPGCLFSPYHHLKDCSMTVSALSYFRVGAHRLYQTCRELRSDVFGVGKQAARWLSDAEEYETYDFRELYAAAEAVFDVRVLLTNAPDRSVLE